ncbi:MAG TPA: Ig-like domain-containing protein, partial [Saprospiraceae bacterium]|nr:Ig-like domain-containing protein [Saprospiraceae bacterium]
MKAFKINKYTLWLMATLFLSLPFSCTREFDDLELATFPSNGDVFLDDFSGGLEYAAFAGSKILAFQVDGTEGYESDAAMRFAVPEPDDPEGSYAGGQFFTSGARDLSGFNVLTFWAKASQPANLDVLGFGNIAEQTTAVTLAAAKVNTNWQQFMIPIPDPSKLMEESSLFFYSEGAEDGSGYTFWIDEIQFERVDGLENPRPTMFNGAEQTITAETGDSISLRDNLNLTHNLPSGVDQTTTTAPGYYNFTSSDPSVATVNNGVVTVLDAGTTVITATLAGQEVAGSLIVESTGEALLPPTAAPTPTVSPDSVISMFSNVYDNVTVDTWNPLWEFSTAQVQDVKIGDDDVKRYKELNFVGILTETEPLDVSAMTHFHIDIWTPDNTDPPAAFRTLLVDFGANEAFGGGDDSSHELTFTSPTLKTGEWVSLDIPLSSFTDLVSRQNIAQLVLSGDIPNVFVDNVYYYIKAEPTLPSEPTVAAPTPTQDAANVVSLFSDAYTDATVDTWRTDWSAADYEEVTVAGDATKKYANLDFVGIETVSNTVDASAMSHLHLDLWSSNHTFFGIKLVDFGADGAFGGGDDVEHQLNFESPLQGEWLSLDIPLDDFTDLTTRSNIGQYILVGQPTGATTLYVDNMFFYGEGGGSGATEPMVAAPTPTQDAANVVSLFSDAYTDATVDTWRTDWSAA